MILFTSICLALSTDGSKPINPDVVAVWVDDLGRLTPFGRTFDVYIQTGFDPEFSKPNGDPRPPYRIGSTYGNELPQRAFGWAIDGELFRNHNPNFYPFLENCQECLDYWESRTGIKCPTAGEYWSCIQSNPYQRSMYLGLNFTPNAWGLIGSCECVPINIDPPGEEFSWCDSWIYHGDFNQRYGVESRIAYPSVQQQYKDLLESNTLIFWPHKETIDGQVCCSSPAQNDYGDLIRWSYTQADWESDEHPGSFRIARMTGPDYFGSAGVIRFACGQGYPCDPEPYIVNFYADNSCPSDLNEDGTVGFQDLLTVLGDLAGFRYHPQTGNGFQAITKVLSEWGECP